MFNYVAIIKSHKRVFKRFFKKKWDLIIYKISTDSRVISKVNLRILKTKNLFTTFHCLCCLVTVNYPIGSFFCAHFEGNCGIA